MKKCLIVVNKYKEESRIFGQLISSYLKEKDIETSFYNFDGFDSGAPFAGNDFVITLGGDGTVLFAARGCASLNIPIFPVNFGEFGFIASVQKEEWQTELELFLKGQLDIIGRSMAEAEVFRPEKEKNVFKGKGLNDVVICSKLSSGTVALEISYNGVPLGKFKSDGIIVSTATGSTAYSASAGGPIIDPLLDALVLTPINSFSLSSRPLVLPPKGVIEAAVLYSRERSIIITIDGQKPFDLNPGDSVKIHRSSDKVKLAGCTSEKFYDALRSKLNWAGGAHA